MFLLKYASIRFCFSFTSLESMNCIYPEKATLDVKQLEETGKPKYSNSELNPEHLQHFAHALIHWEVRGKNATQSTNHVTLANFPCIILFVQFNKLNKRQQFNKMAHAFPGFSFRSLFASRLDYVLEDFMSIPLDFI